MCDWVFQGIKKTTPGTNSERKHYDKELDDFKKELRTRCPSLSLMQDICNGSKHAIITRYIPDVKNTEESPGDFSDDFGKDFNIDELVIELENETLYFSDAIEKVITFWRNYLDNEYRP